jgi:hypothetical protein
MGQGQDKDTRNTHSTRNTYHYCRARQQRVRINMCWYYSCVGVHPYCRDNCSNPEWRKLVKESDKVVCDECGWEQLVLPGVTKCTVCGKPWDVWRKEADGK